MLDATCRPRHVMRWSRKRDGERRNGARGEKEEKEKAKATCILDRDAMREDRGGHESSRGSKTSGHEEEGRAAVLGGLNVPGFAPCVLTRPRAPVREDRVGSDAAVERCRALTRRRRDDERHAIDGSMHASRLPIGAWDGVGLASEGVRERHKEGREASVEEKPAGRASPLTVCDSAGVTRQRACTKARGRSTSAEGSLTARVPSASTEGARSGGASTRLVRNGIVTAECVRARDIRFKDDRWEGAAGAPDTGLRAGRRDH